MSWLLSILSPDHTISACLRLLLRTLRKDHWVCLLRLHLNDFFLLLLFFCLLRDLKKVVVEHLVGMQSVSVRIVLSVVGLVKSLKLVVAFSNSHD